jgi:hypothetical protein
VARDFIFMWMELPQPSCKEFKYFFPIFRHLGYFLHYLFCNTVFVLSIVSGFGSLDGEKNVIELCLFLFLSTATNFHFFRFFKKITFVTSLSNVTKNVLNHGDRFFVCHTFLDHSLLSKFSLFSQNGLKRHFLKRRRIFLLR